MSAQRRSATIAAILAVMPACGNDHGTVTRVPRAAELAGTYDVRATDPETRIATTGVGTVRVAGTTVFLALTEPPVELGGTLRDDGTVALTGHTTRSDVHLPADLVGEFEVRDGTIHFVGVRGAEVPSPLEVVMERPLDANLERLAGTYRLSFLRSPSAHAFASEIVFVLNGAKAALVSDGALSETSTDGSEVARLRFVEAAVAASGRFQLQGSYADPATTCPLMGGGPCLLLVDGTLPVDDEPSSARALLLSGLRMEGWAGTATLERVAR